MYVTNVFIEQFFSTLLNLEGPKKLVTSSSTISPLFDKVSPLIESSAGRVSPNSIGITHTAMTSKFNQALFRATESPYATNGMNPPSLHPNMMLAEPFYVGCPELLHEPLAVKVGHLAVPRVLPRLHGEFYLNALNYQNLNLLSMSPTL